MNDHITVKEPQHPFEGEISLTQNTGEPVVYRDGEWHYINA